jgi:hypothetical protein
MRHSRHSKKSRRHRNRKTRRGGFYGASGPIVQGGDAMEWKAGSEMGGFTADQINKGAKMTGGRKRKTLKRRRRGGGKYGGVSASFDGTGSRGRPNHVGASTRVSGPDDIATFGKFNDNGAHPGDFGSFGGMFPN